MLGEPNSDDHHVTCSSLKNRRGNGGNFSHMSIRLKPTNCRKSLANCKFRRQTWSIRQGRIRRSVSIEEGLGRVRGGWSWKIRFQSCSKSLCLSFYRGWDWCPNYGWLVSHHQTKYLLEIISPILGWCETLGHLPSPLVWQVMACFS